MSAKWWAVYRIGGEYIEHVRAVSGERALDAVSEREGIPLVELTACLDDPRGINPLALMDLGMLPYMSQEIDRELLIPAETIPDNGPTTADMRGEVDHGP